MKHIKLFENFSRDYLKQNNNSLTAFYSGKMTSFNLEKKVLDLLDAFERQVDSTFSDNWNLNRGRSYGRYSGDYFALNVKVHVWPSVEKVKSLTGVGLDDERLADIWYRWLQDQAEMFEEDIKESYRWVDNISWGGNSGGWIHIYPDNGADQLLEKAEEEIQDYLDTKEEFDEEELEEIGKAIDNPEWQRLSDLGLVEDEESVTVIVNKLKSVTEWLNAEIRNLLQIEEDLRAIQRQHREFEKMAEKYFLDFIQEEVTDGHLSENHSPFVIKTEGGANSESGIRISLSNGDREAGVVGIITLDNSNSNDFDPDLVDFLNREAGPFTNDNTYYLHSMEVEPSYRGQGLSKQLLQTCHEIAKANGMSHILLITNCDNTVAQNLYAGFGYRPFDSTGIKDLLVKNLA